MHPVNVLLLQLMVVPLLSSCGYQEWRETDCWDGCMPGETSTPAPLIGPAGPQGPQGAQGDKGEEGDTGPIGANGVRGVSGTVGEQGITGDPGPQGPIGDIGAQGDPGIQGPAGPTGAAGSNAAPTDYTVVGLIDPCGDSPGYDEILLRLANGQLMAHYAGGGNLQFLTVIGPGSYSTTDSQACAFTVTADLEVIY